MELLHQACWVTSEAGNLGAWLAAGVTCHRICAPVDLAIGDKWGRKGYVTRQTAAWQAVACPTAAAVTTLCQIRPVRSLIVCICPGAWVEFYILFIYF